MCQWWEGGGGQERGESRIILLSKLLIKLNDNSRKGMIGLEKI